MKWLEKQLILKIEKDNKDYVITCPKLKGCIAEGETLEKALLNFSHALASYIMSMIKHNEKIDEYSYKISYRPKKKHNQPIDRSI